MVAAICIALLGGALPLFTACAPEQPAPTPKPPEVIKLKLSTYLPPMPNAVLGMDPYEWWATELERRTEGRVEVELFYAESLHKIADSLDALDGGITDIATFPGPSLTGRFPISELCADTPLLGGNQKLEREVLDKLLCAGLLEEYDGYKSLAWITIDPMKLYTTGKKVTKLEDLKGMKIRARGVNSTKIVEALGATPVAIETPELYMSLERGVIDGITTHFWFVDIVKLYEVLDYYVDHSLYGGLVNMLMTESRWNSLPADIQVIMLQVSDEFETAIIDNAKLSIESAKKHAVEQGGEIYTLDPDEWARWQALIEPIVEEVVAELEAKGLPGRKVLEIAEQAKWGYEL